MPDERRAHRGSIPRPVLEALVARDLSVRAIASQLDRSYTTVRYWLGRYGLRTTDRARRRAPVRPTIGDCRRHGRTTYVRAGAGLECAACRAAGVSEWRRRAKRMLVAEAGGRCRLCGYDRCIGALQFHHVDPATKRFAISGRGLARAIDALRAEAAKCVLLCANCHAEVENGIATLPASASPTRLRG